VQITEIFEVEILRTSPAESTGVQTADLVGCPQDDKFCLSAKNYRQARTWVRL